MRLRIFAVIFRLKYFSKFSTEITVLLFYLVFIEIEKVFTVIAGLFRKIGIRKLSCKSNASIFIYETIVNCSLDIIVFFYSFQHILNAVAMVKASWSIFFYHIFFNLIKNNGGIPLAKKSL